MWIKLRVFIDYRNQVYKNSDFPVKFKGYHIYLQTALILVISGWLENVKLDLQITCWILVLIWALHHK